MGKLSLWRKAAIVSTIIATSAGAFTAATIGLLLAGSATAFAQTTSGDLVGAVTDQSGSAIPGASVKATNTATGVSAETKTNGSGEFHIPNLLAGSYSIAASAAGFKTFTLEGFEIELNKTSTAKIVLPVGSSATSVEVSAEASVALDTTTTQLQSTFDTQELQNLPTATVGLGVLNLSLLVPGVSSSGAVGAGTGPSVGGQRPRADNYTVEGVDNNNKSVTGPLIYIPNDAVSEFTVITNQFSPEFGHSTGGQFNSIVQSGTNHFHGKAYEYFDNRDLNAENAIAGGKTPNPRYDFNRYGGQVGGPVLHDKLFFFVNYERQTTGQSSSYHLCTPTAAGMSAIQAVPGLNSNNVGIFTKYTPASPTQVTSDNDVACFNNDGPQTLTLYQGTDQSDNGTSTPVFGSGAAYSIPLGNYLVNAPNFTNFDALTLSTDWRISANDSFRGRYIYNTDGTIDTSANLPAFYQTVPNRFHLLALSEYHNFTPKLINEARLGFNRFYNITPSGNISYPGLDSFPTLYIYDAGFLEIGPDGNAPQSTIQNLYQFTDNVGWLKGNHDLKLGFDGRKFISPQSFTQRVRGDYEWNYLTEYLHDLAPTGFGQRSTGNFFYYGDQTAFYGYANDTWRVSPRISLNYGLRYEFTSIPEGDKEQALNSAASVPGLIDIRKPEPQKKNFLPRVGINFSPNQDTSIRAGFGMGVDVIYDNLGILSFPPQFSSTNTVGDIGGPQPGDPSFLANGGLPAGTGQLAQFSTIAAQRKATSAFVPDQKLPYAETWSLGVQHVFAKNYTAEARYVGTRGIHLPTQIQLNKQPKVDGTHFLPTYLQAPSQGELDSLTNTLTSISARSAVTAPFLAAGFTSSITSYQPYSKSDYNGLATSLTRRFQNGLLLDLAYTYSKTMDDATADVFSTVLTPRRPQNSQDVGADYSRSALDHTHRVTLAGVYDLPFFKHSAWYMKNTIGNWEIAPIYTYESPEWYTVLSGQDSNLNGDQPYTDRAIVNSKGVKGTGSGVTALKNTAGATVAYVANNPDAQYITAGQGALANSGRNSLPIRPINNLDTTAVKRFNFTERYNLEFQAQVFNVLNHAQYLPGAVNTINSPGYTSQILFQEPSTSTFNNPEKVFPANARSMQLALKFSF